MAITKKEYLELLQRSAHDGTFPSVDLEVGICLLRGPNGGKCAIGVLIPDEVFEEDDESSSFSSLFHGKYAPYLPQGLAVVCVMSVQTCHDKYALRCEGWDAELFITEIRAFPFFADVLSEVAA